MAENSVPDLTPLANSWVIRLDKHVLFNGYIVILPLNHSESSGIHEEDGLLFTSGDKVVAFARVYRKRITMDHTVLFLDGVVAIKPEVPTNKLAIVQKGGPISRLDWNIFENELQITCGIKFSSFPTFSGSSSREQAYIRELLQYAVLDDLLGPAGGRTEEIVRMSVRDRYLVGKLAPRDTKIEDEDETSKTSGTVESGSEGDTDASTNQSLVPSSVGLTFCVDSSVNKIEVEANWGRYEHGKSAEAEDKSGKPLRAWKRIPSGDKQVINLAEGVIEPFVIDQDCPEVFIQGVVSAPIKNNDRLVTLFLVNGQDTPEQNQDATWVFQPQLIVRDTETRPIFRRRPVLDINGFDEERESLEMIYRNHVEFAVGHGISVHATTSTLDPDRAVEIRTSVVPMYEVPVTETPGLDPNDRPAMQRLVKEGYLDMKKLADMTAGELTNALSILTYDYERWISEQRERVGGSVQGYNAAAEQALNHCRAALGRLREGIEVLGNNPEALQAFRFANEAMASQRIHSIYSLRRRRGENIELEELDKPENRSWRPFQLAFMLLSIPSLADPTHPDRTESLEAYADLLWFPTGGGKTEAYLGVAAFTMAMRRRQGKLGGLDNTRGLTVIMRYTLRLLTLQQFQRATALICAMEVIRRKAPLVWGEEPFTIGLWVGDRVTPNKIEGSRRAIEAARGNSFGSHSSPAQLTSCPWCGSEISPGRDITVDVARGRTFIYCSDKYGQCDFSMAKSENFGLPVLVVDEEIYRHPPTMMIATVDKFALMAWRGEIRTLFGRVSEECPRHGFLWPDSDCTGNHRKSKDLPSTKVRKVSQVRPPDLIIQDEFHLISGPLGTMVGLYETAVDELSSWNLNEKVVRPKIIASTATVRKAEDQVNNVFLRKVAVFPPHGLDVEDNFFSVQRPVDKKPGRLYMGICSPGSSRPAVLIRVYVAMLTAAQALFDRFGQAADPYMTLVGYFNSLRELGGMRRLAEDDVNTRSYRVGMSDIARPGLNQRSVRIVEELTSRIASKEIPKKLDQLEVKFKRTWAKDDPRAIDIVLATNMLSVGVDVNRLGLMVVNGQPKSTAEYIQATSRVGRAFPGLVCTVLTWSRPRDLSHYETFEHYHATFYKHVEAQSVTPFAPRALDRGLTGTMVSLLRMNGKALNPNLGAKELNDTENAEAKNANTKISDRAWKVRNEVAAKIAASEMIRDRLDQWVREALRPGRRLGYEPGTDDVAGLLKKPGILTWDKFTVPMSMREVEPGVQLVMDTKVLQEPPEWKPMPPKDNQGESGDA